MRVRALARVVAVVVVAGSPGLSGGCSSAPAVADAGPDLVDAPAPDAPTDVRPDLAPDLPCTTCPAYDPDKVYFLGALDPDHQTRFALIDPALPDTVAVGFPSVSIPVIRPSDGHLLYIAYREFDDLRAYTFAQDLPDGGADAGYPADPTANDPGVDTPACPMGVARLYVFPDDSAVAYECSTDPAGQSLFLEGSSQALVPLAVGIVAVGGGRTVLAVQNGTDLLVGTGSHLVGVPVAEQREWFDDLIAVRWVDDHFLAALRQQQMGVTLSPVDQVEIGLDGTVTTTGSYRLDNLSAVNPPAPGRCVLEPGGAMQCLSYDAGQVPPRGQIIRLTTQAAPETVYDDSTHPVKLFPEAWLITGP
jgi:hypothetical protein